MRSYRIIALLVVALFTAALAAHGEAQQKNIKVSLNINAMSTGDESAHQRLADDTRRVLAERLSELAGLEVVEANADLLINVSVIQVDENTYACSSMSFAFSPSCLGLVLFETGVFGKQSSLARIADAIVQDFDVNTLVPYKRTRQ